ncbi:MAG: hypothetical protein KAI99_08655, partial [Cyclobacteriaceae bacterium]|nr:hypothetical protein [Cyclobacteriaceae bacterium]
SFTIYDNNFNDITAITAGTGTAVPWNTLAPGDYYLTAENTVTNCLSENYRATVNDLAENPTISVSLNNPDYGCIPGAATGELEAFATAGSQNIAEYEFIWHQGDILGLDVSNAPPNQFVASNLYANSSTQLYTIEVIDINGTNLGCISTKEYTLLHQPTTVSILSTDITNTNQTICGPNASIVLNRIFEDDGGGPIPTVPDYTGVYDAQLLDQNLNIIDPVTNTYAVFNPVNGEFGLNDIPSATYYVQASNVVTGCAFGPATQVIINDVSTNPIINILQEMPDYACVGGTHTGILAPTLFGGSDNDPAFANFTINWYLQGTLISPATDNGGGLFADKAIDLAPGNYTIEVTDNSNLDEFCITSRDFTVTAARHDIDITASSLDQTICIPDGSAQIETITEDGNVIAVPNAGWFVSLLDDNKNDITPGGVSGYAVDPFINLPAGNYYIQAQDDFSKCYSTPFQVTVNDVSTNPIINMVQE